MAPPRKAQPMDSASVAELRTAIRHRVQHSRENRFLYRLFCVLLLAEGHSPQTVADWMGEHARTLERWRKRFQDNGIDGLLDETSPGRPPKLTPDQLDRVAADLAQPPYVFGFSAEKWQGKFLREHLALRYHVDISLRQCQRLLKHVKQRATPDHRRAEPESESEDDEPAVSRLQTA
jgi:transposase